MSRNFPLLAGSVFGEPSDEGCEVAAAASGREALDLLAEVQPSLALLDIAMPDRDGIETLRRFTEARPEMRGRLTRG